MASTDPQSLWNAVDGYFNAALIPRDPALEGALERSRAAGLPTIAVAENQGRLLNLLASLIGARRTSKSGPWAATPRSGWPAPCRRTAG